VLGLGFCYATHENLQTDHLNIHKQATTSIVTWLLVFNDVTGLLQPSILLITVPIPKLGTNLLHSYLIFATVSSTGHSCTAERRATGAHFHPHNAL